MTIEFNLDALDYRVPSDLSPAQELALLARSLYLHGYDDHNLGHISYRQPDGSLLVNPFELGWDEVRARDVVRMDMSGAVLAGDWNVSPAMELHLALHRARQDVIVGLHHHSRWGTVWASLGRVPTAYDQPSSYLREDRIGVFDEYVGPVSGAQSAEANIEAFADNDITFLGNHGVLVVGKSIQAAHHRAAVLEHRCQLAWEVEMAGGGRPMPKGAALALSQASESSDLRSGHQFNYMIRKIVRMDPDVLT
jgi:L-fuculose-phosphate aldolase